MVESSGAGNASTDDVSSSETGFIASIINEIIYSPLNLLLVTLIAFLIYKIFKSRSDNGVSNVPPEPELPKLRKDFTIQELKKYDGNQPDGRVLVAVNGHVYDVRNTSFFQFTILIRSSFHKSLPILRLIYTIFSLSLFVIFLFNRWRKVDDFTVQVRQIRVSPLMCAFVRSYWFSVIQLANYV